jgi:hypothetical protein
MIQRIQTIYLLAFVVTGILPSFPLWTLNDGKEYFSCKTNILLYYKV